MATHPQIPNLDQLGVLQLWSLLSSFELRLAAELAELGLSVAAFRLIGEVMLEPAGIRQGELARRLGVRPPTVSAAVTRLEQSGLIHRVTDPHDPRARRVCLSANAPLLPGLDVLQRMEVALFDGMTAEERAQTIDMLSTLNRRLQPTREDT